MSEKRFERWNDHSCKVKDNQEDTFLNWEDVVHKLSEVNGQLKDQLEKKENDDEIVKHIDGKVFIKM